MLPEVEKYFADMQTVSDATNEELRAMREEHPLPTVEANDWREYDRVTNVRYELERGIYDRQRSGMEKARRGLLESDDQLVKWLAENTLANYLEHTEEILKVLPARLSELDEIARRSDWCNVYRQFRTAAMRAGVLTDDRTEREKFDAWATEQYGRYALAAINERMELVIAEAIENYKTEQAAQTGATTGEDA